MFDTSEEFFLFRRKVYRQMSFKSELFGQGNNNADEFEAERALAARVLIRLRV